MRLGLNAPMLKQISLTITFLVVSSFVTLVNCSQQREQNSATAKLQFKAPAEWVVEKTSSTMRVAQYKLPKDSGDADDASLVLYYFGQGQGGSTSANIERWLNQVKQSDGSESKDKAKEETFNVNNLKVTTIDVAGTYTAEMAPGSGTFHNNPNYRLRAAVIETPKGSYYLKLVGPEKTVAKWDKSVSDFVKSFEFK
jgi:hypothetical protein